MLLVDSSIWILAEHGRIDLTVVLGGDESSAVCPAIALEVLRGTQNPSRYKLARAALLEAEMLDESTPFERFEQAAQIYLRCRDAGITVRSSIDCLVAATAIAHDATVFHDDRDFERIKRIAPLRTLTRSSAAERW